MLRSQPPSRLSSPTRSSTAPPSTSTTPAPASPPPSSILSPTSKTFAEILSTPSPLPADPSPPTAASTPSPSVPPSPTKTPLLRAQTEPNHTQKRHSGGSFPRVFPGGGGGEDKRRLVQGEEGTPQGELVLEKYTLYETKTKLYIIASNQADSRYRVLKVDRSPVPPGVPKTIDSDAEDEESCSGGLTVTEDAATYSKDQIRALLETLSAGNIGGLTKVQALFYGIVGFVRFTSSYYMILIKARAPVALVGGHYIYHCEETVLRPVTPLQGAKNAEEGRQMAAFLGVDLSKNFYFSYTYDLTHTLQHNLTHSIPTKPAPNAFSTFSDKWVWNRHLLRPGFRGLKSKSSWVLPLIHGFVDQAKLSVFGRTVYIALIARRSRHFAGARFLKRGVNSEGYVANDVETEQIVSDALTTPFHDPPSLSQLKQAEEGGIPTRKPNPRYTSFVQVRGSIPLYWSQESVNMTPKPPIELTVVDPYFAAAALHFDDLLGRYGGPITVLNLIKQNERQPRESKLLPEFHQCIDYLNQFLPEDKRMKYIAWDIAAANKQRDKDVIGILEDIAEESLESTHFFHTGPEPVSYALNHDPDLPTYRSTPLLQTGVTRTNCIDCLDRTNAAQFVIAKAALGHQLHALGIINHPRLPFDSDAVNLITEMFHDHGDTVALQYGGSHLVNTMETYRKIGQWTSHSRDMIENLRRFYANSFVDADKQVAIDLFLGIETSHPSTSLFSRAPRRSYRDWFTKENIEPKLDLADAELRLSQAIDVDGNYWQSYYRPKLFTEFARHFAFNVNSTDKYNASGNSEEEKDHSPFVPRLAAPSPTPRLNVGGMRRWMSHKSRSTVDLRTRIQSQRIDEQMPLPTALLNTSEALVSRLLNPSVNAEETTEYQSYIDQFAHLSLSQDLSEKDELLYRSSAAIASGEDHATITVDRGSVTVYNDAVNRARPGQDLRGAESKGVVTPAVRNVDAPIVFEGRV